MVTRARARHWTDPLNDQWSQKTEPAEPIHTSKPQHTCPEPAEFSLFQKHFSVEQLARAWGMSNDFVRRLFLREPDVVVFYHSRPGRRVYRTLRIPKVVAQRVYGRMKRT
jgi:hypothetical protein